MSRLLFVGLDDFLGENMSSDQMDENGYANCVVCKKKKPCAELSLCQGCMNFACDGSCGSFCHKEHGWLCKKCQAKSKK